MAEVVKNTGVSKEKGYLYYLDKQGDVSRSKMARAGKGGGNAEKVASAGAVSYTHLTLPTKRIV